MNRKLAAFLFVLGMIATPLGFSLIGSVAKPAFAQETEPAVGKPAKATVYMELVKQKLELLTDEELARQTEDLQNELAELQANRKLREAEQQLNQLIDKYPGSAAANRAKNMLKAGLQPTPESNSPFESEDSDFSRPPARTFERNSPARLESTQPASPKKSPKTREVPTATLPLY